jgi:hypothetical protein
MAWRRWSGAETAFGRKGVPQAADVMRFNFPRSDLTVRVGDVTLKPAFALGSWVAFLPTDAGKALAMGDLVLLDNEVGPVMAALQAGGVEQSAVHNHLLNESPHITYMHIMTEGDPAKIAAAVHAALAKSATPIGTAPAGAVPSAELDTGAIAKALGVSGGSTECLPDQRSRARRSWRWATLFRRRWAWRRPSTSSPQARARRRSPATSCCAEAK